MLGGGAWLLERRFSFLFEFVLEVELILNFLNAYYDPRDSQLLRQTHMSCRRKNWFASSLEHVLALSKALVLRFNCSSATASPENRRVLA